MKEYLKAFARRWSVPLIWCPLWLLAVVAEAAYALVVVVIHAVFIVLLSGYIIVVMVLALDKAPKLSIETSGKFLEWLWDHLPKVEDAGGLTWAPAVWDWLDEHWLSPKESV